MLSPYAQQTMVNALPIGAAVFTGPEHTISAVNPQMLAIWSKEASVIGMNLLDALPEIREQGFFELLTDIYTTGKVYHNPDGQAQLLVDGELQTKYFDFSFKPLIDADGAIYGVVNTAIDTTERSLYARQLQNLNEELQASSEEIKSAYEQLNKAHDTLTITDQKTKLLLEGAPVAVGVIDAASLNIDTANHKLLELWNLNGQAIGRSLPDVLPEAESRFLTDLIKQIKEAGHTLYGNDVKAMIARDEQWATAYFNFVYQPIRNLRGEVISVQIVANEVTDQRNAKLEVDAALTQLELAKKATNLGVFDLDVVNDKLYWDDRCRQIFGVSAHKEVGYSSDFAEGLHPEDRERTLQAVADAYDRSLTGGAYDIEYRVIDATDRHISWVRAVGQVYFGEQAEPRRFIGTVVDITPAMEARQKLEESERQLQDFNEELTAINEELNAVNEEYQVTNEELISTNEELQAVQEERDKLYQEVSIKEERLRFAMKAADVGTWDLDITNDLVIWDERCKELYGFSKDDVVPYEQVLKYMHPEDRPRVNEAVRYALDPASGGSYDVEFRTVGAEDERLRWLHCCGKAFFDADGKAYRFSGIAQDITQSYLLQQEVEVAKNNLQFAIEAANFGTWHINAHTRKLIANDRLRQLFGFLPDEEVTVAECIAQITEDHREQVAKAIEVAIVDGGNYDMSYTVKGKHDGQIRWVHAVGNLKVDITGELTAFTGVIIDITEQKQQEQRKSDFIGIVSHELRSPLTSLRGYLQMLELNAKKSSDNFSGNIAAKAKRQTDKMASMITGFLDVARIGEGKIQIDHKPFDMAELVKAAESESLATITTHTVVYHPVEHTPVLADEDKIEQVLINFINNAVKYSPPGTLINVSAITQNGQVRVCVKDEGMGIPEKDLPFVFDRFYRVEGEHMKTTKGFGIGLYLCREIIERHGGKIGVESTMGEGSNFWFEIPVTH